MNRNDVKSTRGNFRALVATSLARGIEDYLAAKEAKDRGVEAVRLHGDPALSGVRRLIDRLESDEEFPFSFVWSCDAMGLDPGRLRKKVQSFKSRREMLDSTIRRAD